MDQEMAIQIASLARDNHGVPAAQSMGTPERRIIELDAEAPGGGRLVRDVRAWIVRFQLGMSWTELAIDESTSSVVRVERSRAR
jgi:hypothetical protein